MKIQKKKKKKIGNGHDNKIICLMSFEYNIKKEREKRIEKKNGNK